MAPSVHLIFSWLSTVEIFSSRRERTLLTIAGIAPDIDGIGLVVDHISGSTNYYAQYHHVASHGLVAAVIITVLTFLLAQKQRVVAAIWAFALVHLHILFDVVGSRGPDGYQWPIFYLFPVSNEFTLKWSGQWALNAWQNHLFLILCGLVCIYYLRVQKVSFFEVLHPALNKAAVGLYERVVRKGA